MHVLEALLRGGSTPPRIKRRALSLLLDLLDTAPSSGSGAPDMGEVHTMSAAEAAAQQGMVFTRHEPYGSGGAEGQAAEGAAGTQVRVCTHACCSSQGLQAVACMCPGRAVSALSCIVATSMRCAWRQPQHNTALHRLAWRIPAAQLIGAPACLPVEAQSKS